MVNPSNREGFNAGTEEGIKVNGAKGLVGPRHKGTAALLVGEGAELCKEVSTIQGLEITSPDSLLTSPDQGCHYYPESSTFYLDMTTSYPNPTGKAILEIACRLPASW